MFETLPDLFNKVISVFSTFKFADFLDIVFVSFVVYGALRIVRETRAVQLLKGFVMLLFVYLLVNLFNMEASSFILKSLFSNALIILVLLFSTEIRQALEQIGNTSFSNLNFFSSLVPDSANQKLSTLIETASKACSELSDQRIGALIVFERQVLLGDVAKTGTVINARPSTALIENIFFPKSPLHDGAMICRDGKIYAAGCILPLSKNDSLAATLGTRHRAALGLSEQSDAIVAVVSEETGIISVAKSGKLRRNLSTGDLIDILSNELLQKDQKKETFAEKLKRGFKRRGK